MGNSRQTDKSIEKLIGEIKSLSAQIVEAEQSIDATASVVADDGEGELKPSELRNLMQQMDSTDRLLGLLDGKCDEFNDKLDGLLKEMGLDLPNELGNDVVDSANQGQADQILPDQDASSPTRDFDLAREPPFESK